MNDRVKEIEERRRWLESHTHTESEAVLCADIEYLLAELKKRDALSLDGLVITRFESDDITGQEFAVYCDDEGRPRIKLCGRNQQAMNAEPPTQGQER